MRSTFLLALILLVPAPAPAQTRDQHAKWCTSPDSSPDLRIGACTALIQAGQETPANLALVMGNRGLGYIDTNQIDKARADFDQALKIDTNCALCYAGRGRAFSALKLYDQALADGNRALSMHATAPHYWGRAMTYLDMEKHALAISDFNAAISAKADFQAAYFGRALAYYRQGKYAESIQDNTKAIQLNPADHLSYFNRGLAYNSNDDVDKAVADFTACLKISPG